MNAQPDYKQLYTHLLGMLGAKDHAEAGAIIGSLHGFAHTPLNLVFGQDVPEVVSTPMFQHCKGESEQWRVALSLISMRLPGKARGDILTEDELAALKEQPRGMSTNLIMPGLTFQPLMELLQREEARIPKMLKQVQEAMVKHEAQDTPADPDDDPGTVPVAGLPVGPA